MENFADPAQILVSGGGAVRVDDKDGLARALCEIFENAALRRDMGHKAKQSVDKFSGRATKESLKAVLQHLEKHA